MNGKKAALIFTNSLLLALLLIFTTSVLYSEEETDAQNNEGDVLPMSIYDFKMKDIHGNMKSLSDYQGKVILVVNVASKCGFTPQYEPLEEIYQKYKERGFVILGFPANDFMWQEPGSDEEILEFCTYNYNVTFPMFSKISVKGRDIHPLYEYLTDEDEHPELGGRIRWNFTKFVISRQGKILNRFEPKVYPNEPFVLQAIEKALAAE